MSAETENILDTFREMLKGPTGDGQVKRNAGTKPHWTIDSSHEQAAYRHIDRWQGGEKADPTSGVHPLIHAAWRLLAVAWQEDEAAGRHTKPTDAQLQFWDDILEATDRDRTRFLVDRAPCATKGSRRVYA